MENILGNRLPVELQRKISLYMEHPTAGLIKEHRSNMYDNLIYLWCDSVMARSIGAMLDFLEKEKYENLIKRNLKLYTEHGRGEDGRRWIYVK